MGVCSPSSYSSPPVLLLELVLRGGSDVTAVGTAPGGKGEEASPVEADIEIFVGVTLPLVYWGGAIQSLLVYCGGGATTPPLVYCGGGGICCPHSPTKVKCT